MTPAERAREIAKRIVLRYVETGYITNTLALTQIACEEVAAALAAQAAQTRALVDGLEWALMMLDSLVYRGGDGDAFLKRQPNMRVELAGYVRRYEQARAALAAAPREPHA